MIFGSQPYWAHATVKKDLKLVLHVNMVGESKNRLARYLVHVGANTMTRVKEL